MESVDGFGGVLPTLDLTIWVRQADNRTMYRFYSKPMSSNSVLQADDNPKWKPLHEGATFNSTGKKHKKILAKSNWFKRSGNNQDDELATKRVRTNPEETIILGRETSLPSILEKETSSIQEGELSHTSILQEDQTGGGIISNEGQGNDTIANVSNKSYIQKSQRAN